MDNPDNSDNSVIDSFNGPSATKIQSYHEGISVCTQQNFMKLNSNKSKYILHLRIIEDLATRFTLNGCRIERETATNVPGCLKEPSCLEITIMKRTYARMSILTDMKYVGLSRTKLLHIFVLHVHMSME